MMEAALSEAMGDQPVEKPDKRKKSSYWSKEIKSSKKMLEKWHRQGNKVVARYLDDRDGTNTALERNSTGAPFRLNVFHSNISTLQSLIYGQLPQIDTSRRYADANDDVARVASEMMERLLNLDLQNNGEDWDSVYKGVLQDRLLPGLGVARVRYEAEFEEVTVAAITDTMGMIIEAERTEERLVQESAPVDYFHWQDVLWGWARSFADVPWIGFASYLSKEEMESRFGEEAAKDVNYSEQKVSTLEDAMGDREDNSPNQTAQVWEIWCKTSKKVYWYSQGYDKLLDCKDDPLQLKGFYPCPPFLMANQTTTLYRPVSDFHLAQDLYNEVDRLQTRIAIITEAVRVVGVYDSGAEGVQRMLKEGVENELIPVDNWAMFAEKGGIQGQIDWLPVEEIAGVLQKLQMIRDDTMRLLQEITGMSEVMKGGGGQYEGVGQAQIKAAFGGTRVQALQDQFAQFAGDLMQIKAEVICKHFEPQTIIKDSNIGYGYDQTFVWPAVELLKDPSMANIRIQVRPETVAMMDYGKLKSERTEFLKGMATFLQSAAPLVQQDPGTMPYLLRMLQWSMAGFKGSQEIEGVLDQAILAASQKSQEKKDDPEKGKEQAKQQGEMQKIQAKAQADMQIRQQDMQMDIQTIQAQNQAKMAEINANAQAKLQEIQMKMQADLQVEQMKVQGNLQQTDANAQAEIQKSAVQTQLDMEKDAAASEQDIAKLAVQSQANLDELKASTLTELIKGADNNDEPTPQ